MSLFSVPLSAYLPFLQEGELAAASRVNHSWHAEARKVAQIKLKEQLGIITTPELALTTLAMRRRIQAVYPRVLIEAIGLPSLLTGQYLDISSHSALFLTLKDHRGPLAFGYDEQNDPYISIHIQMKNEPTKIITYNIWSPSTYLLNDDHYIDTRIAGPFSGLGRSLPGAEGQAILYEFGPFGDLAQDIENPRNQLEKRILPELKQIFKSQHPLYQLYAAQPKDPVPETIIQPPIRQHSRKTLKAIVAFSLTALFFRAVNFTSQTRFHKQAIALL